MQKIFISYSSKNRRIARVIYQCLSKYFDLWIDEKGLLVGDDFKREISNEINKRNIFILLLSKEFWESKFIYEEELPKIFSNKFSYKIPVVLDEISSLDDKRGNFILNKGLAHLNASPRDENGNLISIKNLGLKKSLEYLVNEINRLPFLETYLRFSLDTLKLLHYECKYENIDIIEIKEREIRFNLDGSYKKRVYEPIQNKYYEEYIVNIFEKKLNFKKIKDKLYKDKNITKAYLEEQFGYLFPTKNKVFKKVFKTSAIETLIQEIKNKRKVHIIAPAGVGKTSAMKYLQKEFSKEKIVIFYDVFGEGNYKENKRYKKEKILQQITNELAILVGLEPIEDGDFEIYLRKYLDKLYKWNQKVVIIIDAVDNAVSALKEEGDKNFISEFLNWDFPDNVQIIVTSRKGTRADIGVKLEKIELKHFNVKDVEKFLKLNHIKIREIEIFYNLTKGVGRVCEYAIKDIDNFMKNKKPISLESVFETIYDNATKILLEEEKDIFDILVLLKRPLKLNNIVEIFNFNKEKIISIIESLNPGMFINSNEIIFKDEDFEKFLEDKIKDKAKIHRIIASKLLKSDSTYAKIAVAYHLYNANMKKELFKIAMQNLELEDEITKKEVLKERISLALKVAFDEKNYYLVSKFLLKALEIKKSEFILEEFIDSNPEIIFLKGIEDGVRQLESNYQNEELFFLSYYLYDKDKKKAEFLYKRAVDSIKNLSKFKNSEQIEKLAYYLSYQYALLVEKNNKNEILLKNNYQIWFELEIIKNLKIDINLSKNEFQSMHILKQLLIAYLEYKKGNKIYINYIDDNFVLDKNELNNLFESRYKKDIRDILGIELSEIFLIENKNYYELLKIFKPKDFMEFFGDYSIKYYKNTIFYFSLFPPNELLLNKNEYKDFIEKLKTIYDFYVLALKNEIDIQYRWDDLFKGSFLKDYNNGYKEKYLEFQKHIILFKVAVLKLRSKVDIVLDRLKQIPWYDFELIEFLISQNEKSLALQLIENYFEKIINNDTEIRDKINELIELSEIIKKIDKEYANEILKYAIELTNGKDDNIYNNFSIINHLIKITILPKKFQKEIITTLYNTIEPIKNYSYKFKPYYMVKDIASNLDESLYLGVCYRMDLDNYDEFTNSFYYLDKNLTKEEKYALRYFINNKKLLDSLKGTPLYDKLISYIMIFEKNEIKYNLLKEVDNKEARKFIEFYENEIITVNKKNCDFKVTRENYKILLEKHFDCRKKIFEKLKNTLSNKELLDLMFEHIELSFPDFYEVFFEILEHSLFKREKEGYIKKAIKKYAKYLTIRNWSNLKYDYFFKFLSKKEIIDILIESNLNVFSDNVYVENIGYLIEIVSVLLSNEEKMKLIKENLEIITKDIKLNDFNIEEIELIEFLWRFLAHPDKRKRWKSMYVLKDLIYANPTKYLKIIYKLNDIKPFENKYILNLSGIWYLLLVLHKISFENPKILIDIENKLLEFLYSTKHVLFKRLIKEILINIDEKYREILKFEATSKSNYLKCEYFYNEKFESDYMRNNWDTIHYWYSSITNMFGVDMQEVINIADNYLESWDICIKKLKYKDIHINTSNYDKDHYYIQDNRHGSLPTIEKLNLFLEFHLMFYIVGELLEKKSVCVDFYSDGIFDRFENWIERFYIKNGIWCSDKLSPFPLIKVAFKEVELSELINIKQYIILEGEFNNIEVYSAFISNEFFPKFSKKIKKYNKMDYYEFSFPGFDYEQDEWLRNGYLIKPFKVDYENHCEIQSDDFLNRSFCYEFESNLDFLKYKEWGEEDRYLKKDKKGCIVYSSKNKLLEFLKEKRLNLFRIFVKHKDKKHQFCFDIVKG